MMCSQQLEIYTGKLPAFDCMMHANASHATVFPADMQDRVSVDPAVR